MPWEETALKLGHSNEKAMWDDLYNKFSVSQLAGKFGVSPNVIRARLEKNGVEMRKRGGPNNVKVLIDDTLIQDIIKKGVPTVAKEHNVTPQSLYRRLYYQYGLTVKMLREKATATHSAALQEALSTQGPSSPECEGEQPMQQETSSPVPDPPGDK